MLNHLLPLLVIGCYPVYEGTVVVADRAEPNGEHIYEVYHPGERWTRLRKGGTYTAIPTGDWNATLSGTRAVAFNTADGETKNWNLAVSLRIPDSDFQIIEMVKKYGRDLSEFALGPFREDAARALSECASSLLAKDIDDKTEEIRTCALEKVKKQYEQEGITIVQLNKIHENARK